MTGQGHVAVADFIQAGNHRKDGRFTTSTMSDQADKLTFNDLEVKLFQNRKGAFLGWVDLAEVHQVQVVRS
jgi:DNA-binding NtrC family response regulator